MVKYFPIFLIYQEALPHIWLCTRSHLNFLIYEENFILFFISVISFLLSHFSPSFFSISFPNLPHPHPLLSPLPPHSFLTPLSHTLPYSCSPLFLDVNVGVWEYAEEGPGFNLFLTFKQFVTLRISDAGTVYLSGGYSASSSSTIHNFKTTFLQYFMSPISKRH